MSRQTGWILTGALSIVALGGTAAVAQLNSDSAEQDLGPAMEVAEQSAAPTSASPKPSPSRSPSPSRATDADQDPSASAAPRASSTPTRAAEPAPAPDPVPEPAPGPATISPTPPAVYQPAPLASDSAWTPVSSVSAQSWSAPSAGS